MMLRKTVLSIAAAASFAVAGMAAVAPAQAGYWYRGTWYEEAYVPKHYSCHWEWRKTKVWYHGHYQWVSRKVSVCH